MMTPEEKGSLPIRVEKLFYELQDRIFSDIVRRIRKTKKITSTADYQINKLLLLGGSTEFIESQLKELLEISDPEIWELYDQVCDWEYVRNRAAYEQINGSFTPLEDNETIRKWSNAIVKQTQNEIQNLTQYGNDGGYGRRKGCIYSVSNILPEIPGQSLYGHCDRIL